MWWIIGLVACYFLIWLGLNTSGEVQKRTNEMIAKMDSLKTDAEKIEFLKSYLKTTKSLEEDPCSIQPLVQVKLQELLLTTD